MEERRVGGAEGEGRTGERGREKGDRLGEHADSLMLEEETILPPLPPLLPSPPLLSSLPLRSFSIPHIFHNRSGEVLESPHSPKRLTLRRCEESFLESPSINDHSWLTKQCPCPMLFIYSASDILENHRNEDQCRQD